MGGSMGRFIISVASVALLRSLDRLKQLRRSPTAAAWQILCAFYIHELGLLRRQKQESQHFGKFVGLRKQR